MRRSDIVLFDIGGFAVKIDWSWAILAFLIAWTLAESVFPSLYVGLPRLAYWWMGITGAAGLFLRNAAASSYYDLRTRELLRTRKVRDFMSASSIAVSPGTSIQQFVDEFVLRYHHECFPVVDNGRIIGSIGVARIKKVGREAWPSTIVADVLEPPTEENAIEGGRHPGGAAIDAAARSNPTHGHR